MKLWEQDSKVLDQMLSLNLACSQSASGEVFRRARPGCQVEIFDCAGIVNGIRVTARPHSHSSFILGAPSPYCHG
jgi:hypothetical protein